MSRYLTIVVVAGAWMMFFANPGIAAAGDEVTVTTARRVQPLLIRNEAGALLQIVVDVPRGKDVRLQTLHFKLDGTDNMGDLESLTLCSTGDKQEFATANLFGKPVDAAPTVAFRGDYLLRAGKNVFWLSCRLKPTANLSHKVKAVCTSVATTSGKLSVKDLSPQIRQRIGVALRKHKDDGVHTYRIPALTTTAKGTLLCVYDMRRRMGRDLQEDIDIGLSRSTDGGQTWEPVRVIMDMGKYGGLPEEQNGCSDPGMIVDHKTGEIFCFAVWMHGNPGKHQWNGDGSAPGYEIGKAAQILMVSSKDDGRTWTKPVNLTRKLKKAEWWLFAPSPQQGINLADGTLVMPVQGRDAKGIEFSTIMTSSDHGATWAVGTPAYSGGSECQAVQLGDGSIMLNMRNEHERFRAVFVTKDLGKSWQPHETHRKTLIEPNCNGSLLRVDYEEAGMKKHALLFSNPHTQKGRTHQTIQVSFDDGRTWPEKHHLLLDEGRGAGYPSLTRVDDRHVGIVYEGSQAHLVFEKIPLADLLKTEPPQRTGKVPRPVVKVVKGGESKVKPEDCRTTIVGPRVNQPDPFPGYGGFVAWPSPIRLKSGEWLIGFTAGYWHVSAPTPLRFSPSTIAEYRKMGLPANIVAPTGGRAMILRSTDKGKTWSKPLTLLDTPDDDIYPAFVELPDGTLVCSLFTYPGGDPAEYVKKPSLAQRTAIMRSLDQGKTWDKKLTRLPSPFLGDETDGPMALLKDGSILLTISEYGKGPTQAAVFTSQDRGAKWKLLSTIKADHNLDEANATQLPDGRLVLMARAEGDICWSSDQGRTWTKPVTFGMRLFAPSLYTLRDGTLVCLHGSYAAGNGGLRLIFSTDGGHTWIAPAQDHGFLVDNCYGYGKAMELPDGSLFVVYQETGGHATADAKNMSLRCLRVRIRADHSGIDLLPAPNR